MRSGCQAFESRKKDTAFYRKWSLCRLFDETTFTNEMIENEWEKIIK
jgi:hypothetical protein